MNKQTQKRVDYLEATLSAELAGFYLGREIKSSIYGTLDLPLFGLRFRFTEPNPIEDKGWHVIVVPSEEYIESDELFLLLGQRGYIHWLRKMVSSDKFYRILDSRERWKKILEFALKRAQEENQGIYKISYYKTLLKTPLLEILRMTNSPDAFDWILN